MAKVLLTGSSNPLLAVSVGKLLRIRVDNPISQFADGEIRIRVKPDLLGKEVFILQSTIPPVNDSLMELLLMIDVAKRASSRYINVVIPYYGYARQDRMENPQVPISSALIAKLLKSAGADRMVTIDIHSEQQMGFFDGPWHNLYSIESLIPVLKKELPKDLVVASPDKNGVLRALSFAERLGRKDIVIVYKERDLSAHNKSTALDLLGDVKGKNVLIVDDIIDTATTLINAAEMIKKRGGKKVFAAAPHGLFSGNAIENINQSQIDRVYVSDSVPFKGRGSKFKVVSIAPQISKIIRQLVQ